MLVQYAGGSNEPRKYPRTNGPLCDLLLPLYVGLPLPIVTTLSGYFDDSRNGGVFAVGGYVGLIEECDDHFAPDWRDVIESAPHKISEFKAADCRSRLNEFAKWTPGECVALTTRLVDLVVDVEKYPSLYGVAAALRYDPVPKEQESDMLKQAYITCFTIVIANAWGHAERVAPAGNHELQFVFDRQPKLEGIAQQAFDEAAAIAKDHRTSRIALRTPLQFGNSKDVRPLQAADLLAYETYKGMANFYNDPDRARSKALTRLVVGRPHLAQAIPDWWIKQAERMRATGESPEHLNKLTIYDSTISRRRP